MRRTILAALFAAAALSTASATIVNFSASPLGRSAVNASLATLPDGSQFLVGTFASPGSLSLSLGSIANILAAGGWSQFASPLTIGTAAGNGGKLLGSATDASAAANAFTGKPIYFVIFNATSAATATQLGIFQATSSTGTGLSFPDNLQFPASATVDTNETTIPAVGGVGSTSASPQRFILASVVPEPTAFALLAPGVIGLLGYRRLRRLG
jgi:hypothetical protein